jgi:hypothetical protein
MLVTLLTRDRGAFLRTALMGFLSCGETAAQENDITTLAIRKLESKWFKMNQSAKGSM